MSRFAAVPDIPTSVGAEWQSQILEALKQNVEMLLGLRGEVDATSRAVLKGMVRLNIPELFFSRVDPLTVKGEGYSINGTKVPSLDDYSKLLNDVANLNANMQRLAADVANLHNVITALVQQLSE